MTLASVFQFRSRRRMARIKLCGPEYFIDVASNVFPLATTTIAGICYSYRNCSCFTSPVLLPSVDYIMACVCVSRATRPAL